VHIGRLNSGDVPYLIYLPWWSPKISKPNFREGRPLYVNQVVRDVQRLIGDTLASDAFVSVGANMGYMSMYALNRGNPVYAVEPISWNVAKIVKGINANVERGWVDEDVALRRFHLHHSAAGPESLPFFVNIMRPSDEIGQFNVALLTRESLEQSDLVSETVPLVTVDLLVPDDVAVGVVKIATGQCACALQRGAIPRPMPTKASWVPQA